MANLISASKAKQQSQQARETRAKLEFNTLVDNIEEAINNGKSRILMDCNFLTQENLKKLLDEKYDVKVRNSLGNDIPYTEYKDYKHCSIVVSWE